jgi:hypothetical protein
MVTILLGFGSSPRLRAQEPTLGEYELKAAFLFNFVKFIDWPANSFASPQTPFTICVVGRDPFGHFLDDALAHKKIGDRAIELQRLKGWVDARYCQTVFVSDSESGHLGEIMSSVQGASVLMVGETPGFAMTGGTIEFTLEANHVRFIINQDAVDRAKLKINSQLLALAKVVHDRGGASQANSSQPAGSVDRN